MPMPKIDEVRSLSDQELSDEILSVKKELFELRLQKATRQLNQTHLIRQRKHKLAQLLTVETERQRGISRPVSGEAPEPSLEVAESSAAVEETLDGETTETVEGEAE